MDSVHGWVCEGCGGPGCTPCSRCGAMGCRCGCSTDEIYDDHVAVAAAAATGPPGWICEVCGVIGCVQCGVCGDPECSCLCGDRALPGSPEGGPEPVGETAHGHVVGCPVGQAGVFECAACGSQDCGHCCDCSNMYCQCTCGGGQEEAPVSLTVPACGWCGLQVPAECEGVGCGAHMAALCAGDEARRRAMRGWCCGLYDVGTQCLGCGAEVEHVSAAGWPEAPIYGLCCCERGRVGEPCVTCGEPVVGVPMPEADC